MFFLIITFCTSAAMNDCKVESFGATKTLKQCQAVSSVHRRVLGPERDNHYRLECKKESGDE